MGRNSPGEVVAPPKPRDDPGDTHAGMFHDPVHCKDHNPPHTCTLWRLTEHTGGRENTKTSVKIEGVIREKTWERTWVRENMGERTRVREHRDERT